MQIYYKASSYFHLSSCSLKGEQTDFCFRNQLEITRSRRNQEISLFPLEEGFIDNLEQIHLLELEFLYDSSLDILAAIQRIYLIRT
jgi:hypothetical protein